MATEVIEQVPRYTISHTDDGIQERLQLTINLPGLTSAADFEVRIQRDKFILRSEGRYTLDLPLHPPVEEKPERLQFIKKKALLKAELRVASSDPDAAAPASPPASTASRGFVYQQRQSSLHATDEHTNGSTLPGWWASASASAKKHSKPAAARHPLSHQHRGTRDNEADSDSSLPDLVGNDSDTSPTFSSSPDPFASYGNGDSAASSSHIEQRDFNNLSDHSSPVSCLWTDPASSDSADSDASPGIRHWPNSTERIVAGTATGNAERANHGAGSTSGAESAHVSATHAESAGQGTAEMHAMFPPAQNLQDANLASELFKLSAEAIRDHDWQLAAHLLFKAHMLDGTTAPCLRVALRSLEDELREDVQEHVGAVLARMITERMAPQASASEDAHMGPAKSVREAYEQARIVQLLEALDHPSAEIYGLARPGQMPQRSKAALRAQMQPRDYSHGPAAMAQSQRAQATGPAHAMQAPDQSQQAQGPARNQSSSQGAQATGQRQGAQAQSSQPEQLRRRGKKRPAAQQPSNHALPQARSANVSQPQQQQQQSQGPVAANYGPEQQAEAKRQANKEAALAWMDKARAAALTKDWSAAVQRCQKALSLDSNAVWAKDAHKLLAASQAALQQAGASSDSSTGHATHQQQQRQSKQKQQQSQHQQASEQHDGGSAAAESDTESVAGSATYGQYSYTYGSDGRESSNPTPEPGMPSHDEEKVGDESDGDGLLMKAFTGVLVLLQLASRLMGPAVKACSPFLRTVLAKLLFCLLCVLVCLATCFKILLKVLPAVLVITGNRKSLLKLQAAWKARARWAMVVTYVGSPVLGLVMLYGGFCILANETVKGFLWGNDSCLLWPLKWMLNVARTVVSWFQFGWMSIPIVAFLRWCIPARWFAITSSSYVLWNLMGYTWAAALSSVFSAVLTYFLSFETLSTPVAMMLSQCALNNTYVTGFVYKTVMQACIWAVWWFWQEVLRESVLGNKQSGDQQSGQSSEHSSSGPPPASAGASRPAQPGRQGSTDAKSEVKRILAATTHYSVLEVETTAGEDSIRKARRNKSLVVHPDKTDVAGARDAFDRVTNAAETLCDLSKRRQYDTERVVPPRRPTTSTAGGHAEEHDPNVAWQRCTHCGELHRLIRTTMSAEKARWCKECGCHHTVKMGEGWVTQQGFWSFLNQGELVIYACLHPDGAIYDVTELSVCQGMLDSGAFRQLGVDCCKVWLHFGNPDAARQRQRYQAPNETPAGGRKNKRPKGRRRR